MYCQKCVLKKRIACKKNAKEHVLKTGGKLKFRDFRNNIGLPTGYLFKKVIVQRSAYLFNYCRLYSNADCKAAGVYSALHILFPRWGLWVVVCTLYRVQLGGAFGWSSVHCTEYS